MAAKLQTLCSKIAKLHKPGAQSKPQQYADTEQIQVSQLNTNHLFIILSHVQQAKLENWVNCNRKNTANQVNETTNENICHHVYLLHHPYRNLASRPTD
jgi:hypothetical protein